MKMRSKKRVLKNKKFLIAICISDSYFAATASRPADSESIKAFWASLCWLVNSSIVSSETPESGAFAASN